ncbi:Neurochondrin-domain-containing protein [Cladochytrium replicatum]|nr:Neurochondrin-domain-containing protein [Cladochytrium replicatum]
MQSSQKEQQLEQALAMLAGSASNEDKLVGLMLLPRLVDSSDLATMTKVFARMDFTFLARLLATGNEEDQDAVSPYQAFAVNIIASFCAFRELSGHPKIVQRIPQLSLLLETSENSDVSVTVLECFATMAEHPLAVSQLFQTAVIQRMIRLCQGDTEPIVLTILQRCGETISSSEESKLGESLEPVINSSANEIMQFFANIVVNDQTTRKFDYLERSLQMLSIWQMVFHAKVQMQPVWVDSFREALDQLVKSKLRQQQLDLLFAMISVLVRVFGAKWLFSQQSNAAVSQFVVLVVHRTCAEVRVVLDQVGEQHGSPTTMILSHTDRPARIMPLCYEILEAVINALVATNNEESNTAESDSPHFEIPAATLKSIQEALSETFVAVSAFLAERKDLYRIDMNWAILDDPVTAFSSRALCSWLAEDTSMMARHVANIIPVLLAFTRQRLQCMGNLHPIEFMCPVFLTITSSDNTLQIAFIKADGPQIISELLNKALSAVDGTFSQDSILSLTSIVLTILVTAPSAEYSKSIVTSVHSNLWTILQEYINTKMPELSNASSQPVLIYSNMCCLLFVLQREAALCGVDTAISSDTVNVSFEYLSLAKRVWGSMPVWNDIAEIWFVTLNAITVTIQKRAEFSVQVARSSNLKLLVELLIDTVRNESLSSEEKSSVQLLFSSLLVSKPALQVLSESPLMHQILETIPKNAK